MGDETMSESDEMKKQIEELGKRCAKTEIQVADLRLSTDEAQEAVATLRAKYGLPAASLKERLMQRGVPQRFRTMLANSEKEPLETQALIAARDLLAGKGTLLVLAGNEGRGKSFAAAWALSRRPGIWVYAPDLARVQQEAEGPTLDARMRTASLLVLEEVGKEHSPGGYAAARIVELLFHRDAEKRPTIVTTTLSLVEFIERYGKEQMASRLDGEKLLGWVTVTGKDLRLSNPPHWQEKGER
jgi:DNA replication protein DnaC